MNVFRKEVLKELRKNAGFTQAQLAQKIGVARTTYAEYEQGKIQPPIEKIQRICALFSVDTGELIQVENNTGLDVSKIHFKRVLSETDKIIAIQKLKRKQGILKVLDGMKRTINESDLAESEKTAIASLINYIKINNALTDSDMDLMFRIDRSKNND